MVKTCLPKIDRSGGSFYERADISLVDIIRPIRNANSGCFFREYPIKICSHDFMFLDLMLSGISKALLVYFWITETILLVETT